MDTGYEIEILNLVIDPDYQHRGLARQLVSDLIERGQKNEREAISLEVRRSNFRAGKLYKDMGFKQVGIRKGYYPASTENEDALVMRRILGSADPG